MASAKYASTAEFIVLSAEVGFSKPAVQSSEAVVLAAIGPPNTRYTFVGELVALSALINAQVYPVIQTAEVVLLEAFVSGARQILAGRAWSFTFDNHPFYVISLGNVGTFVYDVSTKQWAAWDTNGLSGLWNMEHGVEWNNGVVGMDNQTNQIWRLNPSSFIDDDFRPITRVSTVGLQADARQTIDTGALTLSATIQFDTPGNNEPGTITLSISDDEGKTFTQLDTITITDPNQEIAWRGLGMVRAPGRVFHVQDDGGFSKINNANLEIAGEDKVKKT